MPPNVKEESEEHYEDGEIAPAKSDAAGDDSMPSVETYKPMEAEPIRRMSIYQWLKGKARDDNIG